MAFNQGHWDGSPILRYPVLRGTNFHHSQGWGYQGREVTIHGKDDHPAHDFAAARGTDLFAPVSGYGFCSFQQLKLRDESGELVLYQGKFICYSLGRVWQIYVPEHKIYVMLAHMETLNLKLGCFIEPDEQEDGVFYPTLLNASPDEVIGQGKWIDQGTLLGTMGTSGLGWGYTERPDYSPAPDIFPTWDPVGPHVHLEVFTRDDKGEKDLRFDPFGIYSNDLSLYEQFTRGELSPTPPGNMWELDAHHQPLYAN